MALTLARRDLIGGAAALALPGCATTSIRSAASAAAACLPRVNVSADRVIRTVAGLRPFRPSGYRVAVELLADKRIVHNYGHGGAGISLSWGSSREAVALGLPGHSGPVAVLGAGVMALSTARLVQEAGFPVTLYAEALPPHTTSNIAGGQILAYGHYDEDRVDTGFVARSEAAADYTRRRLQIMIGDDYGIRWLPTYDQGSDGTITTPVPGFPDRRALRPGEHPMPIERVVRYNILYVETGRYLRQMLRDVQVAGGAVRVRRFATPAEVAALPERLIFNCTGLGAGALFGDTEIVPVRGQLAVLLPQPEVQYAYTGRAGYMFPRADGILLGGTYERGEWRAEPDPAAIARIVERHRDFQAGWRC